MTRIRTATLVEMKRGGEKIACLTAYDAGFAALLDEAGMDVALVGDSLGMVLQGADSTLEVSMRDMIYHSRLVRRGLERGLLVTDMPFMSYADPPRALGNAARLVSEGGAEMVKLEGGAELTETIQLLEGQGIPVCGHLGMQPQSVLRTGGYRVRGRDKVEERGIVQDAHSLEAAGAAMLVLECVPRKLAARIVRELCIPVIGIGAGPDCDGQVLVLQDLLGITAQPPSFCRDFLANAGSVRGALRAYVHAVKENSFPGADESFD